jgi:hypothetical protein
MIIDGLYQNITILISGKSTSIKATANLSKCVVNSNGTRREEASR